MFAYYTFLNYLHREPIDIFEFVDGLHCVGILMLLENKRRGLE